MYVTSKYYTDEYGGKLISQEELEKKLENACEDIDHLTFGRIQRIGFDCLYPRQQTLIRKAVCMQAEYREQYGAALINPIKSYGVGKTRVEMGNVTCGGINTTQDVIDKLEDTGLRCRVL